MACQSLHVAVLVGALVLSAGCQDRMPTTPHPIPAAPLPPTTFPEVDQPSRIFVISPTPTYPISAWTQNSRYVLYDGGTFVLQYGGAGQYRGTYEEADGKLIFTFDGRGWSVAGQPDARGVLEGDTLTVSYNVVMSLSDFEDAVYKRMP